MNRKPRLVAGLITGNEEERIARCIKSYQKICDKIVVIRAIGSAKPDKSLDIARKLGCVIGEYRNAPLCANWPHVDNFAAARNKAFEIAYDHAGADGWVMWADIDDVLPESQIEPHLKALAECPKDCDWILTDYCITEQNKRAPRERFFRHRTGWWWRPVHENMHPVKPVKIWTRRDLESAHHKPALVGRTSGERNMRILEFNDELTGNIKFYLHYEKMIRGMRPEAIRYGAETLALKGVDEVHRYETMLNMSNMTDGGSALRFVQAAEKLDPNRREALALQASIHLDNGNAQEALETLDRMDKIPVPAFPQWTHKAEYYGWKATRLRAWALRASGKAREAFEIEKALLDSSTGPKISVLHATRGRPMQAVATMNLILSRARNPAAVEYIFAVDADDQSAAILQRFGGVCQSEDNGSVGAWNLAASHSTGDILVQMSDDWEVPPGWDEMLTERTDTLSEKCIRISDGYRTDALLPMAIVTRKFYERHGLFNPAFKNQFSDAEFTFRAQKAGAIIEARDIVFVHHHPAFEPHIPIDDTHRRVSNEAERERAKAIFKEITK
jgi:glycosyltransferase involved in cell wall biosynthesis